MILKHNKVFQKIRIPRIINNNRFVLFIATHKRKHTKKNQQECLPHGVADVNMENVGLPFTDAFNCFPMNSITFMAGRII